MLKSAVILVAMTGPDLDRPRKLSVEFNDDVTHSRLLFVDPLERNAP